MRVERKSEKRAGDGRGESGVAAQLRAFDMTGGGPIIVPYRVAVLPAPSTVGRAEARPHSQVTPGVPGERLITSRPLPAAREATQRAGERR